MSTSFDKAFATTVGIEGGYSNNPADSGGETMYGITVAVARAHGYTGPMRSLPLETAKRIYKQSYWDVNKLDQIAELSDRIAHKIFDAGVNVGPSLPAGWLQSSLNIFNRRGRDYSDIAEDRKIGPATVAALKSFLKLRKLEGEIALLKDLNIQQGSHYRNLVIKREKDEVFIFGWYRTRIGIPGLDHG